MQKVITDWVYILTPKELVAMKDKFIGKRCWQWDTIDGYDFFLKDILIDDGHLVIKEKQKNKGKFRAALKNIKIEMNKTKKMINIFLIKRPKVWQTDRVTLNV